MLLRKSSLDKAKAFWKWFVKNNNKYLFVNDVEEAEKEKLMDELLIQLHKYCPELFFEIGSPDNKLVELIITAEGVVDYFDKVEELVDAAPELSGWQFLKFRQPHGPGFTTHYNGKIFDPEKIIFIALYSQDDPDDIGIKVCYPDYTDEEKEIFIHGTYITLDTLIGEKSVMTDIDYLEVVKTPDDVVEDAYPRLSHIGQLIRERKVFKYPGENFCVIDRTDENGYLTFVTVNLAYKNFRYKSDFPWFLKIVLRPERYNENGHPIDEEALLLNAFEGHLESKIKEGAVAHYIGRTTLYKQREIFYYLSSAEQVKFILEAVLDDDKLVRDFKFGIQNDPSWNAVSFMLELNDVDANNS